MREQSDTELARVARGIAYAAAARAIRAGLGCANPHQPDHPFFLDWQLGIMQAHLDAEFLAPAIRSLPTYAKPTDAARPSTGESQPPRFLE